MSIPARNEARSCSRLRASVTNGSPDFADQPAMRLGGFAEPGGGPRRIEDCLCEGTLTFDRETDDFGFLDCALGSLSGRCDNEIADATPLNLGRSLDDCQRIRGDARLDAGRANGF